VTARVCQSCAATDADDATFSRRRGQALMCDDCARLPSTARPQTPTQTRASYRAAYRHRLKQAQGDLIDLIVPPP
jgi:hypothetical protein